MKYFLPIILLFIIVGCSKETSSSASNFSLENPEETVKQLRILVGKLWSEGYPNKDTALVSSLYHPDFKLADDEGTVFDRSSEMKYVADYGDAYENFSFDIENICLYENGTAVVFAKCRFMGTNLDGSIFSKEYLQSLTFSTINQEWKIVYSHVSGVKDETYADAPH